MKKLGFPVPGEKAGGGGGSSGEVAAKSPLSKKSSDSQQSPVYTNKGVFFGMQLLDIEDHLTHNSVDGKVAEWDEWRESVRAEFLHSASTTEDANNFARKLAWLGRRLKPIAHNLSWTSEEHAKWLQWCEECTEWGTKNHYVRDNITESIRWAEAVIVNKGKTPENVVCSENTVAALISALEKDAVCHEALIELQNEASDREVKAARVKAEEERQFILDKAKRAIRGFLEADV